MTLDASLALAQSAIPDCVAIGLVDLQTGMLLAVKTLDSHPQEVLDLVAAATGDIFQGRNVVAIENLFKAIRGVKTDEHYFNEIIINSKNLVHVFQRCKKNDNMVLVVVCRISANLGMVLTKSRLELSKIESQI